MPQNKDVVTQEQLFKREWSVYAVFCTPAPPLALITDPEKSDKLQEYVLNHLKYRFRYATAISIMDAARAIAESQINNGGEELGD